MPTSDTHKSPVLITIPSTDAAFKAHVERLLETAAPRTPKDLEARLRRVFPKVVIRERSLSGERPAWYVYRDGRWLAPVTAAWWTDPSLPRIVISPDGWIAEATSTAAGILGLAPSASGPHHFTDFIVPGTLDDALQLFEVVASGRALEATVLLRPTSGDIVAIDLHAVRTDAGVEAVLRLADDVAVPANGDPHEGPAAVACIPARDAAFRAYVTQALGRMPQPTPEGLALRLRRLYPHASVEVDGTAWVARRDRAVDDIEGPAWWANADLPRVRYDAQALILEANDAAAALFGRQMVGHHWQEFVTPGSTDQVAIMLEILAELGAAESRFRMPRGDGSLMEFDSYTEVVGEELSTVFRPVEAT